MDELDFRYKLSIAWNKTAKFMTADIDTWRNRAILFPMAGLMFVPFLETDNDDLTTAQTETVQQEIAEQIAGLATAQEEGAFTKEDGNAFIASLLAEEDLSERQIQSFVYEYSRDVGYLRETTDYTELGSIGDLRECRADLGGAENTDALVACMVEEGADEKFANNLIIFLALFTMPLALIGQIPVFRREAEKKPRNPKFKH